MTTEQRVELSDDGVIRSAESRLGYQFESPPIEVEPGVHRLRPRMTVGRRIWGPGFWMAEADGRILASRELNDLGPAVIRVAAGERVTLKFSIKGQALLLEGVEIEPVLGDATPATGDSLRSLIADLSGVPEPAALLHLTDRLATEAGEATEANRLRSELAPALGRDDGSVQAIWRALNTLGAPPLPDSAALSSEHVAASVSENGVAVFDLHPGVSAEMRRKILGQGYQAEYILASMLYRPFGAEAAIPHRRSAFLKSLASLDRSFQLDLARGDGLAAYCPVSGRLLRSRHGFCQIRMGAAYMLYRFEGVEVFYVCTGNWPGARLFMYMPARETLVHMVDPRFRWDAVERVVQAFKVNCVLNRHEIRTYLGAEATPAVVYPGTNNLGHHLWNDLAGVELAQVEGVELGTLRIVEPPHSFLDVRSVFPEIEERHVARLESEEAVFAHCVRERLLPIRFTGVEITDTLADRVQRGARRPGGGPPAEITRPLIWMNLRAHNKVWVQQAEGLAAILNALAGEFGSAAGYLDGTPDCAEIAEDIRRRVQPGVELHDGLNVSLHESLNWAETIDAYVATIGSGLTLTTWIADKPGVAHADHGHMHQLEFWDQVRPGSTPPAAPPLDQIRQLGDGMYSNYELDWRVVLGLLRDVLRARGVARPTEVR